MAKLCAICMSAIFVRGMQLVIHDDIEEQLQFVDRFSGRPDFLLFIQAVRNQVENAFPSAKFHLCSYTSSSGSIYYYGYRQNTVVPPRAYFTHDGSFDQSDFLAGFQDFCDVFRFLTGCHERIIAANQIYVMAIDQYITESEIDMDVKQYPCYQFYMNTEQENEILQTPHPVLPKGYDLGSADPDDSVLITRYWKHAKLGDEEQTRQKIACFPSSCVRYEGQPVAFEIVDPNGYLNHQYVIEEHRKNGLGKIVEIDLAKKLIRKDWPVFKCVGVHNEPARSITERNKFWTKSQNSDGSYAVIVYANLKPIIRG